MSIEGFICNFLLGLIAGILCARRGPRGEQGPMGIAGPLGAPGKDGKDGRAYHYDHEEDE